jgi:hypothetical protein
VNWIPEKKDQQKSMTWPKDESKFMTIRNNSCNRCIREKEEVFENNHTLPVYIFDNGSVMVWSCFRSLDELDGKVNQGTYIN